MAKENFLRYLWTSIWLGTGTLIGLILVIWFSLSCNLNTGLLLLWSMAYLVMGGLLGFIFCVPKQISDATPLNTNTALLNNEIQKADVANLRARYQENTNLTQISDWLTKILIGAGLVQLKEVPKFIYHVSEIMGKGVQLTGPVQNVGGSSTIICAAIILFFVTWGFISGYLVMKLVLTEQFAEIDT
jgi:hypothetical protein